MATSMSGSDFWAATMHCHMVRAMLHGCGSQTGQEAGRDRNHRPKQSSPHGDRYPALSHSRQFKLLGRILQLLGLQGSPPFMTIPISENAHCDSHHKQSNARELNPKITVFYLDND